MRANLKTVIVVVLVVIVAVGAVIWIISARQRTEAAVSGLFAEIMKGARLARAKPEGQAEAVQKLMEQCDRLAKEHPSSDATPLALLEVAQLLAKTGPAEKAVAYFRRVIESAGGKATLTSLARRGIAVTLEESNKTREAIAEYRTLLASQKGYARAQTSWDIGRCYQTLGELDSAADFYRKAVEEGGYTGWADLARFRLGEIESAPKSTDKSSADTSGKSSPKPPKSPSKGPVKQPPKALTGRPESEAAATPAGKTQKK